MTKLKGWYIHFTSDRFAGLKLLSTFLSFLINIVMIAVLDRQVANNNSYLDNTRATIFSMNAENVMYSLGLI